MDELNGLGLPVLFRTLVSRAGDAGRRLVELARDEDLGDARRDVTTEACIEPGRRGRAAIVAREAGVVAGLAAVPMVLDAFGAMARHEIAASDGESVEAGAVLGTLDGALADLLRVERTLLNLIGRLSGVATATRAHVEAARAGGGRAQVYDTRKTTPGLRVLEKYAVRCGGGMCHRIGLDDAVLIKDNHLAGVPVRELAAWVARAAARGRALGARFVEVEVDGPEQLEALLTLPRGVIDAVLLDNMSPGALEAAAARRDRAMPGLVLEASGGVGLDTIGRTARTGVDRVSVGALTHGARWLDVSLEIEGAGA